MGQTFSPLELWKDAAPKEVFLKCFTDNCVLSFYNIGDKGEGKKSQSLSSGMVIEQKDKK